uniref:EF-hand domain-containing family member C2 n=1 Tax=Anabas testudineus TaxID=64144 RepID=A0A7N6BAF0_ANATE
MALPFLPGNSSNKYLGKERFHKSQHFDYSNGVPMLVGSEKPGIGGELLVGQKIKPKYTVYPKGQGRGLPSWVAFDKQALCFEAYFQEAVPEARDETYRITKDYYFYLFYNIFHFNLNQQMVLYSRMFTVTNCDSFTRNFLTKLGVRLNEPVHIPDDPYSNLREEKSMKPLRPYERHDTLKQFLEHDRKVLRFYCFWDDTDSVFGDLRELILHYFLADDTIEILEVISPNSGRDTLPKFLQRSKLPKHASIRIKQPGEITDRTVLNVFASPTKGKRYILDSLKTGAVHEDFYKDYDLTVGGEVNVWGRRVIITDCDDFTKEYYRSKYGIEDLAPVQYKAPEAPKPPSLVPPYNGFGSEEDSLSSCQGLLPKPPQKDFHKFMEKDRCGLNSNILNFRAKMVTTDPVDTERLFIISFYLCDDSISVFERPQRNSGVIGGKFLERGRVKKPGQELFKSELSEYFTAQDLYVGATLCLNSKDFQLLDADEYTLKYMEQHAEEFPKSNVGIVLSKLRSIPEEKQSEIRKFLLFSDPSNTGFIPYESFRGLLLGLDCGLSEHEVLVLGRQFSVREDPEADMGLMLAVAQDILRKKQFEELPDLTRAFSYRDQHKTGRLSTKEARAICKSFQLPLPETLLGGLLSK